jgi:hypothetical protein
MKQRRRSEPRRTAHLNDQDLLLEILSQKFIGHSSWLAFSRLVVSMVSVVVEVAV